MKELSILYGNNKQVFYSSQPVYGQVVLELGQPVEICGVY
jgi:hypothetical protein